MDEKEKLKKSVQINKLINSKSFNEALPIIETVLNEDLTDFEFANVYNQKAICLFNLEQFDDALLYFEKSWTLDEYFLNHKLYDIAFQKVYKKNYNKAYWLCRYIQSIKDNDEGKSLKYHKLFFKNNPELSNDEISDFVGINTDIKINSPGLLSKEEYIELADECLILGDTRKAIEYLDKISGDDSILINKVDLIMDYAVSQINIIHEDYFGFWQLIYFLNRAAIVNDDALLIKAYYLFDAGYFEESLKCYDDYLKIHKNNQRAVSGKICVLNELGEFDEAIDLVKLLPINNKMAFQSEILIAKGDYNEANKFLNSVLKRYKENIPTFLRKAILDLLNLNFEKVLKSLDKIINLKPNNLEARLMKGEILGGLHRKNDAIKLFQEIPNSMLRGYKGYMKYLGESNIKNTGFYGVSQINSDGYNWEYAYVESNIFKRLKSYYLDDLKVKVEIRGLPWKVIDKGLAEITISKNNKLLESSGHDETTDHDQSDDTNSTGEGMKRFNHIGRINDVKIEDNETNETLVGLEIPYTMNELSEENQKLKKDAEEHEWMASQFDIRLGRLQKENLNLKQLIVRGADKDESAEDILRIAEKLGLIKR